MPALIFDVGFHRGEDTRYYLENGYQVVAVDADPRNIAWAENEFSKHIAQGQLRLEHAAVSDSEGTIDFHLSKTTVWSSIKSGIADRRGRTDRVIQVPTRRLDRLFEQYGTPLYCKIDVEGYDAVCAKTLRDAPNLPQYISVETECLAEGQKGGPDLYLETLFVLRDLGYNRFKLVDQTSLQVLDAARIYDDRPLSIAAAIHKFFNRRGYDHLFRRAKRESRAELKARLGYDFPPGASGPFGDSLAGQWSTIAQAERLLESHRSDYFRMSSARDFGFWCDWHATRFSEGV